ncbi:MAG: hypothetical protein A2041_02810 [Bacteroidetes bacterium GWA2_31_9b]|nr:MAG: hypothetical protein A2041_02810 [Bacteroidetes bacterium GWA2_31_9b]
MNDLIEKIHKVENKWLDSLYNNCKDLFSGSTVPSHDHDHHLRVWNYCKEIITELAPTHLIEYELIESLIIASFFHDTGLTITLSENHGKQSRLICENYFDRNNIEKPLSFIQVLEAIEKHDNKNYTNKQVPESILSILCTADDIDAFGLIGVIRYSEIYMLRGLNMNQLSDSVIKNLDKRFAHFESTYKFLPVLFEKHYKKYQIARRFFEALENEIALTNIEE